MDINKKENVVEESIDLIELLQNIWKQKWVILTLAVIMGALAFVKVQYFTDDVYRSSGILYVSNRKDTTISDDSIKASDINASREFSTTYIQILQTRSFLKSISEKTGGKYTWAQIGRMMNISAVEETELLSIVVTAGNPEDAYEITSAILNNASSKLTGVFKNGDVSIVDDAVMPKAPMSKGVIRQIALGAIIGVVMGIAYVFIRNFFDTKVRKSEDVEKRYNVSVLGEIAQ